MVPRQLLNHLPAQVSSFIGREGELAEVRRWSTGRGWSPLPARAGWARPGWGCRWRPGWLDGFADGVWFADLAPLRVPDLVAATVATCWVSGRSRGARCRTRWSRRWAGGACWCCWTTASTSSDACAKLADALLRGCPNLALLATSREPLGIDGERYTGCPPWVPRPTAMTWRRSGPARRCGCLPTEPPQQGVVLAWDEPTAAVVGRICRRLDGIPLALELAAARLRVMSAAELDARLDERFALLTGGSRAALPRQRTLRAMVDWSWELLTGPERAVLARLSVFAGGFGLAAAEAVAAGADVPAGEVLGHLGALVDKSLVQFDDAGTGPGRYRLLETVRQYAAAQARTRRARRRQIMPGLPTATITWLWPRRRPRSSGRTTRPSGWTALMPSWAICGPRSRYCLTPGGRRARPPAGRLPAGVLEDARAPSRGSRRPPRPAGRCPPPAERRCCAPAAWPPRRTCSSRPESMRPPRNTARRGWPSPGPPGMTTWSPTCCTCAPWSCCAAGSRTPRCRSSSPASAWPASRRAPPDRPPAGRPVVRPDLRGTMPPRPAMPRESLRLFRQAGDRRHVGTTLGNLGYVELSRGDLDAARRHLAESLDTARALERPLRRGHTRRFNLGLAEYLSGSLAAAEDLFTESLDLATRMGTRAGIGLRPDRPGHDRPSHGGGGPEGRLVGTAARRGRPALAALGETLEPLEGGLRDRDCQRLRGAWAPRPSRPSTPQDVP